MQDERVLAIYGASGLGREILELACIINDMRRRWDEIIFVDDGDAPESIAGCKVYAYDKAISRFGSSMKFTMGVGEPATRSKLFSKIQNDGISVTTLVHPLVHIPQSTTIGEGTVIQYGCFVSCNVRIGRGVLLQPHCNVGHDCVLGDNCIMSSSCNLSGNVHVGDNAYVAVAVSVREGISVGSNSIIGMGSMVLRDIPDGVIAMGNPARPLKKNTDMRVFGS